MDEIMLKAKEFKEFSLADFVIKYKDFIYPIMFYIAGLGCGSALTKLLGDRFIKTLSSIFNTYSNIFQTQLIIHFCVYFSVFTISILLGLCLIGFPVINFIPFLIGIEVAIKLCYYYTTYSSKGIGYSLLMIIPEASAYMTVLIYTIVKSNMLSKNIFSIVSKKSDIIEEINLKLYLKSFVLYGIIIAIISVINSGLNSFLLTIISIN